MTEQHIVVIGAGYAGLTAAARAGRRKQVTLIEPESRFLHRVRQHETAADHPEHRPAIDHLLRGRRVTHVQDRVAELDLAGRKLMMDSGQAVGYDTLVYALGSCTAWHGIPGAAERAYSLERAAELKQRLTNAPRPGTVAVVGGGATGIEDAAELAEAYPQWQVRLVAANEVGDWFSVRGRAHVLHVLERLGVQLYEHTRVTAVGPDGLHTVQGPIEAEVVVWAASMAPNELAAEAGLAVTSHGQAVVDQYLRSVSHPEVYVIGDAAAVTVPGVGKLRMSCATAQPMGRYLGDLLSGKTSKPFAFKYVVQCLSLGRRDGLLQLIHGDDSMRPTVFTGAVARLAKAAIVSGVVSSLR
jgi:NADH dehydrogenase FAD-containing subunit